MRNITVREPPRRSLAEQMYKNSDRFIIREFGGITQRYVWKHTFEPIEDAALGEVMEIVHHYAKYSEQ